MADLNSFVGRSFVIQRTRYGALDGLVGKVVKVERIPAGINPETDGLYFRDVLVVETESKEFPSAIAMPINLGKEII